MDECTAIPASKIVPFFLKIHNKKIKFIEEKRERIKNEFKYERK